MCRTAAYSAVLALLLILFPASAYGQDPDSAYLARVQDTEDRYFRQHPRQRLSQEDRKFHVVPLYGIMYTQETGLLAMGGFMGSYRMTADTLVPISSVGAVAMFSTNLSAAAAVTGDWYGAGGNIRIEYLLRFNSSRRYFWGLGYSMADDDMNRGTFTNRRVRARADFLYCGTGGILAGGFAGYDYYRAVEFSDPDVMAGQPMLTHYLTLGGRFELDTRDDKISPERGIFLNAEPSVSFPLAGTRPFFRTELTFDFYFPLWEGGVAAVDLYGNVSTGQSPWTVWPDAGGDVRLRGYYQGRYRDRNLLSAQLELRQRIYGSHGAAVWGGAGNVFPSFNGFDIKNTLPTYGAGYRFSFLGLVLRLDAGFGLHGQWALIAGVSHSF